MRKSAVVVFSISIIPLLFGCSTPAASPRPNANSGNSTDPHTAANAVQSSTPTPIPATVSYLPQAGYQYTYSADGTTTTNTYTKEKPDSSDFVYHEDLVADLMGGTWLKGTTANGDGSGTQPGNTYWLYENSKCLMLCSGNFDSAQMQLKYPVSMNESWTQDPQTDDVTRKITGVGLTVSTPAGHFSDVILVHRTDSQDEEFYEYLAPHVGVIESESLRANEHPLIILLTSIKKIS